MSDTLSNTDAPRSRGEAFADALKRDQAHRAQVRNLRPLARLWPFMSSYRGLIAVSLAFLLLSSAFTLGLTGAGRLIIDCGFAAEPEAYCGAVGGEGASLNLYFVIAFVVATLMAVTSAIRYYFVSKLGERVVAGIRSAVYDHILKLSPAFFERTRTGEVLSRLTTDTTLIQTVVGSSASIALRTSINVVGALIIMVFVSWKLTLLAFAVIPFILVPLTLFGRRMKRLSRETQDQIADVSAYAGESLSAIQTVQAFTREAFDSARFTKAVEAAFGVSMQRIVVRAIMTAFLFTFAFGGVIAALWYGANEVQSGAMSDGALLMFVMLAFIVASGGAFLTEVWTDLLRAAGASERLAELLSEEPDIAAPESPAVLPSEVRGAVAFEGVTFAYPTRRETPAMKTFSLNIAPGETVALVGPSGAGKSTVFQLLLRFFDPDTGRVAIDGVDLKDLDPRDVRGAIAAVQQSAPLFSGTARDNIRYGRVDASDADVEAAAKAAMAHDFIAALPDGYDTPLGEGAATLSGGQRQRLAIARAILRNAPILLLDEATSALDAESEHAIQQAFEGLSKDRTTLVIAHRLATVLKADRIVVMDGGRIVDEGTHGELVAKGGLYARLAELQFEADADIRRAAAV